MQTLAPELLTRSEVLPPELQDWDQFFQRFFFSRRSSNRYALEPRNPVDAGQFRLEYPSGSSDIADARIVRFGDGPVEKFAADITLDAALERLLQESSLPPYAEMLRKAGLIDEPGDLSVELEKIRYQGRSIDTVRNELKVAYRERLLAHLSSFETPEASHQELLRLSEGLLPADKGSLHENWYAELYTSK